MSSQVALVALALEKQTLMHHIMRCDLEKVKLTLANIDNESGEI